MTAALRLSGVSKSYGSGHRRVTALRGASVEVAAGEYLGIIGPSGSGKTTFLMLAGLVEPRSTGEIWLAGARVSDPSSTIGHLRRLRRHIGFVFQKANLLPFLTAGDNVRVALEATGVSGAAARRRAGDLLEDLGLGHRIDAFPQTLSGGEQQRVAIARALANRPTLLLADEPTAALDSRLREQIMGLLRRLAHEEGVTVCVVTHDARTSGHFDRLIEIRDGEIATPAPDGHGPH